MASHRIRRTKTRAVVLDTSAILTVFELSIDLSSELQRLLGSHRIVIPEPVKKELRSLLESRGGKKKQQAEAALQYIQQYKIVDTSTDDADDAIFNLVSTHRWIAVTNDKELRNRLRSASFPVVYLRGKNRLVLEGSMD